MLNFINMIFQLDFTRFNVFSWPVLFCAVISLFQGILIYYKDRANILNRRFAFWCLILSGQCFSVFFLDLSTNILTAFFWAKMSYVFLSMFFPTFFSFILDFVELKQKKLMIANLWLLGFFFLILVIFTPYFLNTVEPSTDPFFPFQLITAPAYIIYAFLFLIGIICSFFLLANSRSKSTSFKQNQIFYLILAIILGGTLALLGMILIFLRLNVRIAHITPYIGGSIYILLVSYAILKHRLMDISFVIRKGLVYTLIIGLFTGLYLSSIFILGNLLQGITGRTYAFISILSIIFFAVAFQPLKNHIQTQIDKKFFKGKYNYQKTLRELSHASTSIIDLDELLKLVSKTIVERLNIEQTSIYTLDEKGAAYKLTNKNQVN